MGGGGDVNGIFDDSEIIRNGDTEGTFLECQVYVGVKSTFFCKDTESGVDGRFSRTRDIWDYTCCSGEVTSRLTGTGPD